MKYSIDQNPPGNWIHCPMSCATKEMSNLRLNTGATQSWHTIRRCVLLNVIPKRLVNRTRIVRRVTFNWIDLTAATMTLSSLFKCRPTQMNWCNKSNCIKRVASISFHQNDANKLNWCQRHLISMQTNRFRCSPTCWMLNGVSHLDIAFRPIVTLMWAKRFAWKIQWHRNSSPTFGCAAAFAWTEATI